MSKTKDLRKTKVLRILFHPVLYNRETNAVDCIWPDDGMHPEFPAARFSDREALEKGEDPLGSVPPGAWGLVTCDADHLLDWELPIEPALTQETSLIDLGVFERISSEFSLPTEDASLFETLMSSKTRLVSLLRMARHLGATHFITQRIETDAPFP